MTNKMRINRGNYLQKWTGVNDPLIKVKVGADAMLFYFELVVILLCTKLAGDISVRLGQPSVLGKLIVGIIIGPAVLGIINSSELIDELSEIGVLLLMFMAGLENGFRRVKSEFEIVICSSGWWNYFSFHRWLCNRIAVWINTVPCHFFRVITLRNIG